MAIIPELSGEDKGLYSILCKTTATELELQPYSLLEASKLILITCNTA